MSALKKIFIISTVLLVITLFFLGIYNLAFKSKKEIISDSKISKSTDIKTDNTTKNETQNKDTVNQKIYPITSEAVISPFLLEDGKTIRYYAKSNGNTLETSPDGKSNKIVSAVILSDLKNIIWNPSGNKVISYFFKDGKDLISVFDFVKKESKKFAESMSSVTWLSVGDKIAYKFSDPGKKTMTISVADWDGSNWNNLVETNIKNVKIAQIPESSMLSFWNIPNSLEETSLNTVGTIGGDKKVIFSGKFGADYLWSPNGEKVLVSSVDASGGSKMSLGVMNKNGGEYKDLGTPTFASKCVWSKNGKTIYYALPTFSDDSKMLPDDYDNRKISSQDTFWKMDVISGQKDRVVELDQIKGSFDAEGLFLSKEEDALFFVNRIDGKLYRMDL